MASLTTDEECQNFHRLVSLLIDVGSKVLRKLFMKYAVQQSSTLNQHLLNNKTKLQTLQNKRHILSQSQMDILFPPQGKADDTTFDITLLSCLLKNVCGTLPIQEKQDVEDLRDSRNKISGHMARAALSQNDFMTQWGKISQLISNIAKYSGDVQFAKDVQNDIQDLWKKPEMRPSLRLNDILLQWYKSDKEVKYQLEEVEETSKQRHDEVTSELKALKTTTDSQYEDTQAELQELKAATSKQHAETLEELACARETAEKTSVEVKADMKDTKESMEKQQSEMKKDIDTRLDDVSHRTEELERKVDMHKEVVDLPLEKLRKVSRQFLQTNTRGQIVKTTLMEDALSVLKEKGCCIISGKPGEGKTMAAATIMKENFDFEKCLVLSHPRDWSMVDIDKTEAIFIDDVFGIYQLDHGKLLEWMDILPKLESCAGPDHGKIKLIIATRSTILHECRAKIGRFKIFGNVVEFSSDHLLHEEKVKMLSLSLQQNGKSLDADKVRECVSNFTSPIGFPFCCQLFSTNNSLFSLGIHFFRKPSKFFIENLAALEEVKFAAMVFLFYQNGKVSTADLRLNKEEHCNDLRDISSSLGMQQTILPSVVRRQLDLLKGAYVTCGHGIVKFVHNTVFEAIGLLYGKSNPMYVIRTCSSDFLFQCITVESTAVDWDESVEKLWVEDDCYEELIDRLISEVIDMKHVSRTAAHPALRVEEFYTLFVESILSKGLEKIFFTSEDRYSGKTFLHSFSRSFSDHKNAFTHNLGIILKYMGKCKHLPTDTIEECWKCEVRFDCMNACCLCGNTQAYSLLLDYGAVPDTKTLNFAVRGSDVDIVRTVIGYGVKQDSETLNSAVWAGNVDIVRAVIDHGAVPDTDILRSAVLVGNVDVVKAVMEKGPLPDTHTLKYAIEGGNVDIVRAVSRHGTVPDTETLKCSIQGGNVDIVIAVLEHGAVPDTEIVDCAVIEGDIAIVRAVLEHADRPDAETIMGVVMGGNVDFVRAVLEHGAVPTTETVKCAVEGDNVDIVRAVLESGAIPDADALYSAIVNNNTDIVKVVLEHGARPNEEAVDHAIYAGNVDIIKAVMPHIAVLNTDVLRRDVWEGNVDIVKAMMEHRSVPDTEVLNCAVERGYVDIVKILMERGTAPSTLTVKYAVEGGNIDIVRTVLAHGVLPDKATVNCSIERGNTDIVKMVLEPGAVPDTGTLNFAVEGGNGDIVKALVEHGAVPGTLTVNCAVEGGHVDIVKLMLEHGAVPDAETANCGVRGGIVDILRVVLEHGAVPHREYLDLSVRRGATDIVILLMKHNLLPDFKTVISTVKAGNIDTFVSVMDHVPDSLRLPYAVCGETVGNIVRMLEGQITDTDTLRCAVERGNVEIVKIVMEHGAVPDNEILRVAVRGGDVDIVSTVVNYEAIANTETEIWAVMGGNIDIVRVVMEHGVLPNTNTIDCAIQTGDENIVKEVIKHGAKPSNMNLKLAVRFGNMDIIKLLMDQCISTYTGYFDTLRLILTHKGDLSSLPKDLLFAPTELAAICLYCAILQENCPIVERIISQGVVPDTETLDFALGSSASDVATTVLKYFDIDSLKTRTIEQALLRGHINVIEKITRHRLPEVHTDTTKQNSEKQDCVGEIKERPILGTMLCGSDIDTDQECLCACKLPDVAILNRMILAGDVDISMRLVTFHRLKLHVSTLSASVRNGDAEMVKCVLERGAKGNTQTLRDAIWEGKFSIVRNMMEHNVVPDANIVRCAMLEGDKEIMLEVLEAYSDQKQGASEQDYIRDLKIRLINEAVLNGDGINNVQGYPVLGELPDVDTLNRKVLTGDIDTLRLVTSLGMQLHRSTTIAAIRRRNVEMLSFLLEHGPAADTEMLRCAIIEGNDFIIEEVLAKGARADACCVRCAEGNSFISKEVLQRMIESSENERGFDVVQKSKKYGSVSDRRIQVVNKAVMGDIEEIEELIVKLGALPDLATVNRMVLIGDMDTVRLVASLGMRLDESTTNAAIKSSNAEMVRFVMEQGAEANSQTMQNAIWEGKATIIGILMEHKVVPSMELLWCAVMEGNNDIVSALLTNAIANQSLNIKSTQGLLLVTSQTDRLPVPILKVQKHTDKTQNSKYWCKLSTSSNDRVSSVIKKLQAGHSGKYVDLQKSLDEVQGETEVSFLLCNEDISSTNSVLCAVLGAHSVVVDQLGSILLNPKCHCKFFEVSQGMVDTLITNSSSQSFT